ncbi:hypothetical protein ACHAXR_005150 [Thalassiosira sp. AJA248-18]
MTDLPPKRLEHSIFGRAKAVEEAETKKLGTSKMKWGISGGSGGGPKEDIDNSIAKILDPTCANVKTISLKAFNSFTFPSLAKTINDLDPKCKIVGERVQFLPYLLPTPNEIQSIKTHKGSDSKLNPVAQFFRELIPIKRTEDKVRMMQTMATFEEQIEELRVTSKHYKRQFLVYLREGLSNQGFTLLW